MVHKPFLQILAKRSRVITRNPDVLVQMKPVNAGPVDAFLLDQFTEHLKLRCPGCNDKVGPSVLFDRLTKVCRGRLGDPLAHR